MFTLDDLADFLDVPVENLSAVRVRVLSNKAQALILQYAPGLGDDPALWPEVVRDLGLSVVARAVESGSHSGVESTSYTAGPFETTNNYSSDSGTVWLTKQEKSLLRGHAGSSAFGVDLIPRETVTGGRWLTPTWWEPLA